MFLKYYEVNKIFSTDINIQKKSLETFLKIIWMA